VVTAGRTVVPALSFVDHNYPPGGQWKAM